MEARLREATERNVESLSMAAAAAIQRRRGTHRQSDERAAVEETRAAGEDVRRPGSQRAAQC